MIKVTSSNVEALSKKIMTDAKEVSMKHVKNGKLFNVCEYGFTKVSTAESRKCAADKLYKAVNNLPKECGEVFATIV